MDAVFSLLEGLVLALGAPAYLVLQVWAGIAVRETGWRLMVLAPLLLSVPIAGWCLYALGQDSNLWPLPFILFAPLGVLYLGVVLVLRGTIRTLA
jgi:hypothetical protein